MSRDVFRALSSAIRYPSAYHGRFYFAVRRRDEIKYLAQYNADYSLDFPATSVKNRDWYSAMEKVGLPDRERPTSFLPLLLRR